MFDNLLVVLRKEVRDALRDKRSLRLAFLPPLYFVAMFVAGVLFAVNLSQSSASDISLSVAGEEHLPELVTFLREQGIAIEPAPGDAYSAVEQQLLDKVLIIPAEAEREFARAEPAVIWLVYDASNPKLHASVSFVRQKISQWSQQQASLRILARSISPELVRPVMLRESNVASDRKMAGYVLGSLPMFILMCVFIGSLGFSADMTAGERERHSLESLLITPASSTALMAGKWLTSVLLTLAVMLLFVVCLAPALAFLPFNRLGLRVDVSLVDYLLILLATLPVIFLATALQLLVAIFARSFKDAQTYTGLLIFVPLLPFLYTIVNPGVYADWFFWVPVLAQQSALRELLLGSPLPEFTLAKMWLSALPLAALTFMLAALQLRRARIVYG
jgi:sodium transport system permease protein